MNSSPPGNMMAQIREHLLTPKAKALIAGKTEPTEAWTALDKKYGDKELALQAGQPGYEQRRRLQKGGDPPTGSQQSKSHLKGSGSRGGTVQQCVSSSAASIQAVRIALGQMVSSTLTAPRDREGQAPPLPDAPRVQAILPCCWHYQQLRYDKL